MSEDPSAMFDRFRKSQEPAATDAAAKNAVLEQALTKALRDNHIHEGFRDTIRRLVFDNNDGWRTCCGSACDPCVLPMARCVDQIRKLINYQPGDQDPKPR